MHLYFISQFLGNKANQENKAKNIFLFLFLFLQDMGIHPFAAIVPNKDQDIAHNLEKHLDQTALRDYCTRSSGDSREPQLRSRALFRSDLD